MPRDEQTSDKDNMTATMAWPVVLHALVPLFWLGLVSYAIPRGRVLYDQLGSALPASTRTAFTFYDFVRHYPYIYLLVLVFFLAADAVIYLGALRSRGRVAACSWSMFVLLVQGVLTIGALLAFFLPLKTMIAEMPT